MTVRAISNPKRHVLAVLAMLLGGILSFLGRFSTVDGPEVLVGYILLTALVCVFFLLGLAIVIVANTDASGALRAPASLAAVVGWATLIPLGGMAIGALVNFSSGLAILNASVETQGKEVLQMDNGAVLLDGVIGPATLRSLLEVQASRPVEFLLLRSGGGSLQTATEIARIVEGEAIPTMVLEECSSACVVIALSGVDPVVEPGSRIGFHRASVTVDNRSQLGRFIGNSGTESMVTELRRLGVPEWLLEITENTPADQMHYVSGEKMVELGLFARLTGSSR